MIERRPGSDATFRFGDACDHLRTNRDAWSSPLYTSRSVPLIRTLRDVDGLTVSWSLGHPADLVWRHLVDRGKLPQWLGLPLTWSCLEGGHVRIDHGEGYVCESLVKSVDPTGHRLEISWKFPDEHETAVAVGIEPAAAGAARLTLVHDGLAALLESYEPGWITHLTYFEASLDGTPLPPEQFWHLHDTLRVRR